MNLQEQINRIHQIMGILNENEGGSLSVEFLPLGERKEKADLVKEIAIACYGTEERINFSEQFSPHKVPGDKVENFRKFLMRVPKFLWAVKYGDEVVGFYLISDNLHPNSIGFGINVEYAGKGIMTNAFELIKNNSNIEYPLYGYTFKSNEASKNLMIKLGFVEKRELEYEGYLSVEFVYNPNNNAKDEKSKKDVEDKKKMIQMLTFSDSSPEHNNAIIFDYLKSSFIDEFVFNNFEDSEKEFKKHELSKKKFKYEDLDKETKKKWNTFINSLRD